MKSGLNNCLWLFFLLGLTSLSAQTVPAPDSAPTTTVNANVEVPKSLNAQELETFGWMLSARGGLLGLNLTEAEMEMVVKGVRSANSDSRPPLTASSIGAKLDAYLQNAHSIRQTKVAETNRKLGREYMEAEAKADPSLIKHAAGFYYKILSQGSGATPSATDTVQIAYTIKLPNVGLIEDSSKAAAVPQFVVKNSIPGLMLGLSLIKEGGTVRLLLPDNLAYKDAQQGPIPPGSYLDVELTLTKILPPEAPAVTDNVGEPATK